MAQTAATQAELQRVCEELAAARAAQLILAQRDGELTALRTQLAEQRTLIDRLASGERPLPATIDTPAR